jgi:DNA-binding GntR family transcriptional regulator
MSEPKSRARIEGVDTRPLRQQIADALQSAILNGELKPGEALIETEIASRLGVSRAPVREALQLLSSSGLVETIAYRGTTVRALSERDIEEVYSLRTLLETFALRRSMARDRSGLAAALSATCESMGEHASNGDWASVADDDQRFHQTLIATADHSLLNHVWNDLNVRVRQIMALRNLRNESTMTIVYNHLPIVEAIARGDVAEAEERLAKHIATAADLLQTPSA